MQAIQDVNRSGMQGDQYQQQFPGQFGQNNQIQPYGQNNVGQDMMQQNRSSQIQPYGENRASTVAVPGGPQMGAPVVDANKRASTIQAETEAMFGPDDKEDEGDEFKPITEITLPEPVQMFFALTGIADIQYKVQQEREKRQDEGYQNPYLEVEEIVMSVYFESLIASAILVNCLILGWQASVAEGEMAGFFGGIEFFFTLFFFAEWCLRITAFGWVWVFEPVNFADSTLVFGPMFLKFVAEPAGMDLSDFRSLTVLRVLRLVRLARAVRLMPSFKEMWILIRGLTTSARPLLWTLVIACAVLYVFAIAATEFIGKSPTFKDDEYAQLLFGDFLRSMFTMVQLITMDTYCDLVIRPLMRVEPMLALFFVFFITVGVFIVMNLVTAIIVENAFNIVKEDTESVAKEEEMKKKRDLKLLSELFMEIDLDGSGELSRSEFFGSLKNKKVKQMLDTLEMKVCELEEIWEVLDDGDGLLTIKEFTDGIRRMKGEAKAKDVADVIKKLRLTDRKHQELQQQAQRYGNTLWALEQDTAQMAKDTDELVCLFKEMYHRLSSHIFKGEKEDKFRVRELEKLAKMAAGFEEEEAEEESSEEEGNE